jgi:hypothetical protein
MAEPALAAPRRRELTREQREYQFRSIVAHLSEAEAWPKLFDLLEEKPFLADQADHFGGFEQSGADIEQHALPAVIRQGDWNRFLRHATLALNLRGVAEALAEPDILRALVRGGRLNLARDVVDRLADPLRRVEARAVLAAACRSRSSDFRDLLRGIEEALDNAVPTALVLAAIARHVGPELSSRWPRWIERLPPEEDAAPVWAAVAGSWLDRGETRDSSLWGALAAIRDRRLLLELTARLGWLDRGDLEETLEKIGSLFGDDVPSRWHAFATFLDRQTRRRAEQAVAAWERWVASEPIVWTAEMVESCREVLQRLSPRRIETFLAGLEDPEVRVAVRVADLEARPDVHRTAAALDAVSGIPDGPAKLHWSLRYLEARPPEPADEVRGQVGAVAAYLYELRYDAAPGDLRRFLDLAARSYPKEIGRLVEDVAWSPASRPETLLTLANDTLREEVARHLLEHAERFAAAVSLTEAEGFRLRGILIRKAARRLCLLRKDLQRLETAVERLLPEEEDDLREELAPHLGDADRKDQAREAAEGIRDPRRRFLTLLRVLPPKDLPPDFLGSRSLYASMATARPLEEERLALTALLQNPFDPQELARRHITPIRSGDLQTQALLRLARHALAFQRSFYGRRQDPAAALEVVRGTIAVETDEKLAALTPEIAALGAELGPKEAVAEFQEAARRLAGLDTVPWRARAEAMEHLLSLIQPVFLRSGRERERKAARRAADVLESIARLPLGSQTDGALGELRSHWHEILPVVLAVAGRLPEATLRSFPKAVREGISACGEAGGEASRTVFELCLASPAERTLRAERALEDPEPGPILLRALVYLLAAREPQRAVEILPSLPAEERDPLAVRLLRHGWLCAQGSRHLLASIDDPALREEAAAWSHLRDSEGGAWLEALTALAPLRHLDLCEPGWGPQLGRLWEIDPERSRPALAGAFLRGLRTGGRERGEALLRLWLHAHLAPQLGTEQPSRLEWSEQAKLGMERAMSLSPSGDR